MFKSLAIAAVERSIPFLTNFTVIRFFQNIIGNN